MGSKIKGTIAEREILHLFWKNSWACIRVAGSGSMKYPCPDLLAGNNLRKLAIECKAINDNKKYLTKQEVSDLIEFARRFGAEPWIAIKFIGDGWYFLNPEDMQINSSTISISLEEAKKKGLSFDELIQNG